MICHELQSIGLSSAALMHGSAMHDFDWTGDLNSYELDALHNGKAASITHMMADGNGFPATQFSTHIMRTAFDMGCTIERRDMRSMLVWSRDYDQCLADKKCGRVA